MKHKANPRIPRLSWRNMDAASDGAIQACLDRGRAVLLRPFERRSGRRRLSVPALSPRQQIQRPLVRRVDL